MYTLKKVALSYNMAWDEFDSIRTFFLLNHELLLKSMVYNYQNRTPGCEIIAKKVTEC